MNDKPPVSGANWKPGDIVGFSGFDLSSAAINLLTWGIPYWGLSHVAIVGERSGKLYLFESTTWTIAPCEIFRVRVEGVQAHDIEKRIKAYPGRVWRYRLSMPLSPYENQQLSSYLFGELGKRYDYLGIIAAGGFIWSWVAGKISKQNLTSLWCSELVAAAIQKSGIWPISNASWWSPNRLVRKLRRKGVLQPPVRIK